MSRRGYKNAQFRSVTLRKSISWNLAPEEKIILFPPATLYNLNIYLWPLKPHNFRTASCIWKIITFLKSLRQAGWFDLFESDIQALLIFDPLITLWGNFDAPYLKLLNDASVASACFYVRTCRRVRNSKKIATIRDFHLPGSFLCLSTRLLYHFINKKKKFTLNLKKWNIFFCVTVCCISPTQAFHTPTNLIAYTYYV